MDANMNRRRVYANCAKERELIVMLLLKLLVDEFNSLAGGGAHGPIGVRTQTIQCWEGGNGLGAILAQCVDHRAAGVLIRVRRRLDECRNRMVGIETQIPQSSRSHHDYFRIWLVQVLDEDRDVRRTSAQR